MKNLFSVRDKVVVITGGSGFLGQRYMAAFEQRGAKVINWDLDTGVDIAKPFNVQEAARKVIADHGRIDVLINNAAFNPSVNLGAGQSADNWVGYECFPPSLWRDEIDLNLSGQMFATQAVAKYMMEQKSGSIVFIASDLALIGPNNSIYDPGKFKDIAYVASKAGVVGMMRAWAAYLGPHKVRANALVLGGVKRDQPEEFVKKNSALNMLGRMAEPDEYSGALIFLASGASSYMTGSCMVIDGGRVAW